MHAMPEQPADAVLGYLETVLGQPGDTGDNSLLDQFVAARDGAAFAALVVRHGLMVLGVCRRLLEHEQDAEDAFQATFLVLARRAESVRNREAVASWLYGVAVRVARRVRSEKARRRQREQQMARPADAVTNTAHDSGELRAVLDEELDRLPERYRLPLLLCYLEGRTNEEAGRLLGWPVGTVKGRLARARDLLRGRLARRGLAPSAAVLTAVLAESAGAVPAPLADATVRVSLTAGDAPIQVVALAEGVIATMTATRWVPVLMLILIAGVLGGGAIVLHLPAGPPPIADGKTAPAQEAKKRPTKDAQGDPLPPAALARLGTIRFRTPGGIDSLAFSTDGRALAAACNDRTVVVFDPATGKQIEQAQGHKEWNGLVRFTRDGKHLLLEDAQSAILWDRAAGKEARRFETKDQRRFYCIDLAPDEKTLAAVADDRMLHVWDVASGAELRQFKLPEEWAAPMFFLDEGKSIAVLSMGRRVIVFDAKDGTERRRFLATPRENDSTRCTAISSDGGLLALSAVGDTAYVWDVARGKKLDEHRWEGTTITALAFSPDGKTLAAGGQGHTIQLWDRTGRNSPNSIRARGYFSMVALGFAPDGKTLAAVSGEKHNVVRLWDVATLKELPQSAVSGHQEAVHGVLFAPDGRELVTTSWADRTLRFWDPGTARELRQWDEVSPIAYTPDGAGLLVRTEKEREDGLQVRDLKTGRVVKTFTGHTAAFAPDGKTVAVVDGWEMHLQEAASGRQLHSFRREGSMFSTVQFTRDGKVVAAGATAYTPRVGDALPAEVKLWEAATGKELGAFEGNVFGFLAGDGRLLSGGGQTVRLYDRVTLGALWRLPAGSPKEPRKYYQLLAVSPDGRLAAVATRANFSEKDLPVLGLWETWSGRQVAELKGHRGKVETAAFAADGKTLATASEDTTVLVWDVGVATGRADLAPPAPADLEKLWADLLSEDAAVAYRAAGRLTAAPDQTVPLLRDRLRPAAALEGARVRQLLDALDSKNFGVRQKSARELVTLGLAVEPALREVLTGKPTLEVRKRIEEVLAEIARLPGGLTPEDLRHLRAVDVLEHIGTPAARGVLRALAGGRADASLTEEARSSLRRMGP
jgi:RNA polymerase sigma factor (sigma-70 family)